MKISSKKLNFSSLDYLIQANPELDAVMLLTNFGYIVGELHFSDSEKLETIEDIIFDTNKKTLESLESNGEKFEKVSDGSLVTIKNAMVKYSNNMTLNFRELTIHCDQVVGFCPINKESYLSQLPK